MTAKEFVNRLETVLRDNFDAEIGRFEDEPLTIGITFIER